jgi:homoserine kinase type II
MTHVYVVQHVHTAQDGGEEDVKFIGVYRVRSDADAAVGRLRLLPGFRDHPNGFEVTEYELNKDHWIEGFISWKEAHGETQEGETSTSS